MYVKFLKISKIRVIPLIKMSKEQKDKTNKGRNTISKYHIRKYPISTVIKERRIKMMSWHFLQLMKIHKSYSSKVRIGLAGSLIDG